MRNRSFIHSSGRLILEDYAEVHGLSTSGVRFGRGVSIGSYAMIRPSGYYSRPLGYGLTVGDDSSIGPYSYIGCSGRITIGDRVMLAPGVRLFAEDHRFADPDVSIKSQGVEIKPIVIEDDCWIASGVTILGGVTVGKGAVVAAGSVVTADVEPHTVVGGIPARLLRRI